MVVFQALTWEARDVEGEHQISIFGKTEEGKSICVTTTFDPYFFVKLPKGTKPSDVTRLYNDINALRRDHVTSYSLTKQKDVWGFQNNEEFHFMHLNFKTLEARRKVNSIFMYNNDFKKYHVYESNIDPVLRLMHRTGIQSTGWLDTGSELCALASRQDGYRPVV
jgi:DNA polymerase delta subunit 1